MRFVDGEQGDAAAVQQRQEAPGQQPLRCDVQQVQFAAQQGLFDLLGLVGGQRGIQEGGAHAELAQRVHLVLHQRDQRGDDDAGAVAQQRGHLVAEGLAGAGWHEDQGIVAGGEVFDNGLLVATEGAVTEDALEGFECGGRHGCKDNAMTGVGLVRGHRGLSDIPLARGRNSSWCERSG